VSRGLPSQAKVLGTVVALGGAMLMTLVKGPMMNLPWTNGNGHHESTGAANKQDPIKGAVMILAGCVCWSAFVILQVSAPLIFPIQFFYIYNDIRYFYSKSCWLLL
jgi:drug/metabolite transporter (DMT)-like permease